jgi:predicted membrane channel-forming protein YqfA (hemolysin III family)
MTSEERRAWSLAATSLIAYVVYLFVLLSGAAYVPALLWTVGGAVVVNIAVDISFGRGQRADQRDREIGRFGDHIGQSMVIAGAVAAMLLALFEARYFWIANVIYLAFVLSAILGSTAKIFAYRRGFHPW